MKTVALAALVALLAGCSAASSPDPARLEQARREAGTAAVMPTAEASGPEGMFERQCGICHSQSKLYPGFRSLQVRGVEQPALAQRTDLDKDYVQQVVRNGLGSMPPFKPSQLTDADLEAISTWLAKGAK